MTERHLTDGGSDRDQSTSQSELTYEIGDEPPSEAVVRAVSTFTDTSPLDLDPLYDVVDPEHLDGTVTGTDAAVVQAELSFVFNACEVTLTREAVHVSAIDAER